MELFAAYMIVGLGLSNARRIGMNTASTASQNTGATGKDAREGGTSKAAFESSGDIERDLKALREEFAHLAEQVANIVTNTGNAAWRRAKARMDGAVSDAENKGREAAGAVREVSDKFVDAIDDSIKTRPYTTLALVAGLAFLFGATWRR
jgi:ElaB/YqjD/DUF883 family membrane-anchored ribosome-binding protein